MESPGGHSGGHLSGSNCKFQIRRENPCQSDSVRHEFLFEFEIYILKLETVIIANGFQCPRFASLTRCPRGLRGGLGRVEAMTERVATAQVGHLGIYRDKKSLLPIEYYNKLPKKVTVHTVFVLDPMPISGATAVAAMAILKAWNNREHTCTHP